MKNEFFPISDNRMSGIRAPRRPRDHVEVLAEDVDDLPLPFVAPLRADDYDILYLVCHGLVKLGLVVLLWRGKRWSFPLAAGVLALFVIWLGIRWTHTHAGILLLLGGFDLVMVWPILAEYGRLRPGVQPEVLPAR